MVTPFFIEMIHGSHQYLLSKNYKDIDEGAYIIKTIKLYVLNDTLKKEMETKIKQIDADWEKEKKNIDETIFNDHEKNVAKRKNSSDRLQKLISYMYGFVHKHDL